uniref:Uncharacterized protein n=1 Tax=Serinus canaria TaxID=9135 RepID=A0A8C9NAM4_SERCA
MKQRRTFIIPRRQDKQCCVLITTPLFCWLSFFHVIISVRLPRKGSKDTTISEMQNRF